MRPNVQRTLRTYVEANGPCRASEAVHACFPTATDTRALYAALVVDAAEGRLDRLDWGLYDRRILSGAR